MRINTTVRHQTYQSMHELRARIHRGEKLPTQVAIPDVHGVFEQLRIILATKQVHAADQVIFLGDYFDRGAGPEDVFKRLVALNRKNPKYVFLLGNHELNMLMALRGSAPDFLCWLMNGGLPQIRKHIYAQAFFDAIDRERASCGYDELPKLMNAVFTKHREAFDNCLRAVGKNDYFIEVFNWLVENCRLFHVDALGTLYLHAGIEFNGQLEVEILDHLAACERSFVESLKNNKTEPPAVVPKFRKNLEMRPNEWLDPLCEEEEMWGEIMVRQALYIRGIRGLVCGHTPRAEALVTGRRIFGIDLENLIGSRGFYKGCGGFLEMGENGVICHQFYGMISTELQPHVLIPRDEYRDILLADAESLIAN